MKKEKRNKQAEEQTYEKPGQSQQTANGVELQLVSINWFESFWPRACYLEG